MGGELKTALEIALEREETASEVFRGRSEAARMMDRLIDLALWTGPSGVGVSCDQARRNMERLRWRQPREDLDFTSRPGAFLQREKERRGFRGLLDGLRSDDLQDLMFEPYMLQNFEDHGNRVVFSIPMPGKDDA